VEETLLVEWVLISAGVMASAFLLLCALQSMREDEGEPEE
jgi:hypothetical protein